MAILFFPIKLTSQAMKHIQVKFWGSVKRSPFDVRVRTTHRQNILSFRRRYDRVWPHASERLRNLLTRIPEVFSITSVLRSNTVFISRKWSVSKSLISEESHLWAYSYDAILVLWQVQRAVSLYSNLVVTYMGPSMCVPALYCSFSLEQTFYNSTNQSKNGRLQFLTKLLITRDSLRPKRESSHLMCGESLRLDAVGFALATAEFDGL